MVPPKVTLIHIISCHVRQTASGHLCPSKHVKGLKWTLTTYIKGKTTLGTHHNDTSRLKTTSWTYIIWSFMLAQYVWREDQNITGVVPSWPVSSERRKENFRRNHTDGMTSSLYSYILQGLCLYFTSIANKSDSFSQSNATSPSNAGLTHWTSVRFVEKDTSETHSLADCWLDVSQPSVYVYM